MIGCAFDHHAAIVSPQRELVKPFHSSQRDSLYRDIAGARNQHNAGMATDAEDQARRIAGLRAFYEANAKAGLENPHVWAKAAGVSYNTLNEPISGAKIPNISIKTLERLADAASKLLKRPVTIDDLIGRTAPVPELDELAESVFGRMTAEQKSAAIKRLADSLASPSREQ